MTHTYMTEEDMRDERARVAEAQTGVLADVRQELDRQLDKWGVQEHSLPEWVAIEAEEFGEAAMDSNKAYFTAQDLLDRLDDARRAHDLDAARVIMAESNAAYDHMARARGEYIQVAAVATAAAENIDRKLAEGDRTRAVLEQLFALIDLAHAQPEGDYLENPA